MSRNRGLGPVSGGRLKLLAIVFVLLLVWSGGNVSAEVFALCDVTTGKVMIRDTWDEATQKILGGPFPGRRTAALWVMESCPSEECNAQGRCMEGQDETIGNGDGDGWVVGKLSSVTLGKTPPRPQSAAVAGPTRGRRTDIGPGAADLSPLINTAAAAAKACNYRAALASADHMTNFDPEHPWLVANHDKIRRLDRRQQATVQAVWEASSALSAGQLERARDLAAMAADSSVSCQAPAVSTLLDGIETAMRQQREAKNMARSRAAAALLPGLVDLARVIGGGQPNLTAPTTDQGVQVVSTLIPGGADPCGFSLEYRDLTSLEPVCTCPGYFFDLGSFRCVAAGR